MSQEMVRERVDLAALLEPVSEEQPTGSFLLYEGTYDRIKEARRFDDPNLPRGVWQHDLKVADWSEVEELCSEALINRSKDLQIAAWLLEAAMRQRGFQGLAEGVELMNGLCERYWKDLFPPLDDDVDFRIAPFHWMNEKLAPEVFTIPVAIPDGQRELAVTWNHWKRAIWIENLKARQRTGEAEEAQLRSAITLDDFTHRVGRTPRAFYQSLLDQLDRAVEEIRTLEGFLDEALREESPSLVRLREHLLEIHGWARTVLRNRPESSPEDVMEPDENDLPEDQSSAPPDTGVEAEHLDDQPVPSGQSSSQIRGREDAYRQIARAAQYLREIEPHSPAPYMILRAVEWGEKPLSDLIVELRRNGLDLDSLSSLLGLNQEGDM